MQGAARVKKRYFAAEQSLDVSGGDVAVHAS